MDDAFHSSAKNAKTIKMFHYKWSARLLWDCDLLGISYEQYYIQITDNNDTYKKQIVCSFVVILYTFGIAFVCAIQ